MLIGLRISCPLFEYLSSTDTAPYFPFREKIDVYFRLEKYPTIRLITVGPVIDLYGQFAAEKLARIMELHSDRVYSKPEFIALPPYLFSGADFALIPSRDEPFGLVAIEFSRKGAPDVGSQLGGLSVMPGWVG